MKRATVAAIVDFIKAMALATVYVLALVLVDSLAK